MRRRLLSGGMLVALSGVAANVSSYLVPLVAVRDLSPGDFSTLVTLLVLFTIASVPGLGLQLAVAVAVARHGNVAPGRPALATAAITLVVTAALSPLAVVQLALPWPLVLVTIATTVPVVAMGGWLGVLQGQRRFGRLAAGIAALGCLRCTGIAGALAVGSAPWSALAGGLLGALLAAAVIPALARTPAVAPIPRGLGRAVLTSTLANVAMLLVSYTDLLAARHILPPDGSAEYGVLNLVTKGALWAPQVITVLAVPYLSRGVRGAVAAALGAMTLAGLGLTIAGAIGQDLAVKLVGGDRYHDLAPEVPYFAATGALYALVLLLVTIQIADNARWPSVPLWLAATGFAVAVTLLPVRGLHALISCALVSASACALSLVFVIVLRRVRVARRGLGGTDRWQPPAVVPARTPISTEPGTG